MKIAAYILARDVGYSPNPFHGWLTLACCKPAIRRTAKPGDWVVGITPAGLGHRLAYAMQVEEVLTFEQYWNDRRFRVKRPLYESPDRVLRRGDNCYKPIGDGAFEQLLCDHGPAEVRKDLSGRHVLVARRFAYFGSKPRPLPERLRFMIPGRGHRSNFTPEQKRAIVQHLEKLPLGPHAHPRKWVEGAEWQTTGRRPRCG